jgi:hypothetical protein
VTAPRGEPAGPRTPRPAARQYIPGPPSKEDLLEWMEPTDYPTYPGHFFPEFPGIDDFPELRRTRDPEPDLEAEP